MSATPYHIKTEEELVFSFVSEGKHGRIVKIVKYVETAPGLFNLGFGDQTGRDFDFDDLAITDNGDMAKVIATVIKTMLLFFKHYPTAAINIEGSTPVRTRFYNRIANNYYEYFKPIFRLYGGFQKLKTEPFIKNKNYDYLVVTKK